MTGAMLACGAVLLIVAGLIYAGAFRGRAYEPDREVLAGILLAVPGFALIIIGLIFAAGAST